MKLTHHAVERFLGRWGGSEEELHVLAAEAVRTKHRTPNGQEIWESAGVRFVVKRDRGKREPVCVTILPALPERDLVDPWNSND